MTEPACSAPLLGSAAQACDLCPMPTANPLAALLAPARDAIRPRWRLLRAGARRGPDFECNLCGWTGASLRRGLHEAERHCPRCKSSNRHRLIAWYLAEARLLHPGGTVLHAAPEASLARLIANAPGITYESCDLVRTDVDHRIDLQRDIIAADRYDLILINHVLEHVPSDRAALRNLRRMLRPGGLCLITVPMREAGLPTDEDPAVTDPTERRRRFGQDDHVRIYGLDFTDKLTQCGFQSDLYTSADADAAAVTRYAMAGETIFRAC